METIAKRIHVTAPDYCGLILSGDFSVELKKRVAETIDHYRLFEGTGSAAILYDQDVVDACLRLFYEKNFQYPS